MGCVTSKHNLSEVHPNIFYVMNVDDMGQIISPGQLEVTDKELVLYQRGKSPTRWPLRCLRKYGCDSELFTFECGRRCPTGPGIYAFKCRKAEQLFNLLQQNLTEESHLGIGVTSIGNGTEFHGPAVISGPSVHRRTPSQPEGYSSNNSSTVRTHPTLSRPGSIVSNGQLSPTSTSPPPITESFEHNNNKRGSLVPEHSYTNTSSLIEIENTPSYMNLNSVTSPKITSENYVNLPEANCHLYMNVSTFDASLLSSPTTKDTQTEIPPTLNLEHDLEEFKHNYANIDSSKLEKFRPALNINFDKISLPPSVPQTPTYISVREMNYVELDLITGGKTNPNPQPQPESPNKVKKSYVTIDFDKTNALSQSINPRADVEEGIRKTRHNSTICEVSSSRQRNSLSD